MGCSVVEVDAATHQPQGLQRWPVLEHHRPHYVSVDIALERGETQQRRVTLQKAHRATGKFTCFMKYIKQTLSILHFYVSLQEHIWS